MISWSQVQFHNCVTSKPIFQQALLQNPQTLTHTHSSQELSFEFAEAFNIRSLFKVTEGTSADTYLFQCNQNWSGSSPKPSAHAKELERGSRPISNGWLWGRASLCGLLYLAIMQNNSVSQLQGSFRTCQNDWSFSQQTIWQAGVNTTTCPLHSTLQNILRSLYSSLLLDKRLLSPAHIHTWISSLA